MPVTAREKTANGVAILEGQMGPIGVIQVDHLLGSRQRLEHRSAKGTVEGILVFEGAIEPFSKDVVVAVPDRAHAGKAMMEDWRKYRGRRWSVYCTP